MATVTVSPALRAGWWLQRHLYRLTNGRIGGRLDGFDVLLLTTTGRRTGRARAAALMMLPRGDAWCVVASHAGSDFEPAWWLNLQAHREADVQLGASHRQVRARQATCPERDEIWARFVAVSSAFAEYQQRTERAIAVVILEPTGT